MPTKEEMIEAAGGAQPAEKAAVVLPVGAPGALPPVDLMEEIEHPHLDDPGGASNLGAAQRGLDFVECEWARVTPAVRALVTR